MKKHLVPRLVLSICVLLETQNVSDSPKKREFKNKSPGGKVTARNTKLKNCTESCLKFHLRTFFYF